MANGNAIVSRTRTPQASCKQTILETDLLNSGCCCRHVKAARTWIGLEPRLQLNVHSVLLMLFECPSVLDGLYCGFWEAWMQRKHSSSSKRLLASPLMHDGIRLTKNPCDAGYPCTTQHDEPIERHDVLKKKQAIYKARTRDKWKKKKQTRERERESVCVCVCVGSDNEITPTKRSERERDREGGRDGGETESSDSKKRAKTVKRKKKVRELRAPSRSPRRC
jgi:hypothetical protein